MLGANGRIAVLGMAILGLAGCDEMTTALATGHVPFTTVAESKPLGAEVTALQVAASAGRVKVIGGTEDEVRVEAEVKLRKSRAETETQTGEFADHVRLEIKDSRLVIANAHMTQPDTDDWQVSLVIHAPARLATTVSIAAGDLQVEGMSSELDVSSAAGNISVTCEDVGGLKVSTEAGSIDIRVAGVGGPVVATVTVGNVSLKVAKSAPSHDVRLASATGNVVLDLPEDSPGTYLAQTDVGNVQVAGLKGISAKRSGIGARAEGTVGDGGPTYHLTAGVGTVTVR